MIVTTEHVAKFLRQNWGALANGESKPEGFSFVLITKGREPVGKLVFLVFPARARAPRFAIKLARLKEQNASVQAEYLSLRVIEPYGTFGRVLSPKALLCQEQEGWLLLIESVIEGVQLSEADGPRSVAFVPPIVDWLIHLGRSTCQLSSRGNDAENVPELVERAGRHAVTRGERQVLDQVSGRLLALEGAPLPRVFEQRDMGSWNLMVARDGKIGVLDWESSRAHGFPGWDLFYFLAHYGFMVQRTGSLRARLESFHDTFFGHHGFGGTARSAARRYIDAMALREEWLGPLFLGCWLHHTLSEVSRLGMKLSDSLFWQMLAATLDRDRRLNFLGRS